MGSLLVRAMFGERVVGRFALQRGKRSSENGFQTTFGGEGRVRKAVTCKDVEGMCGFLGK